MIRLIRRGTINMRWLTRYTHKTRLRALAEPNSDTDQMLATINEDSETFDEQTTRAAKHQKVQKRAKTGKKVKKEELGRVFHTRFSVKNSYALFLARMKSAQTFGELPIG